MDPGGVPRLRPSLRTSAPGLGVEREWWGRGAEVIVGLDEVGRGAWAGPLSVGAAVIPRDRRVYKVRDSKLLTSAERRALVPRLRAWCRAWSVGHASPAECDLLGMAAAQRLAAHRALEALEVEPDVVLVDGNRDFVGRGRVVPVPSGDRTSLTIATASILAKEARDELMEQLAVDFPAYGFASNKGYPEPRHLAALAAFGPSTVHRTSWAFVDDLPWGGIRRRRAQRTLFDAPS